MSDHWLKALGMGARGQQIPDDWSSVADGLFHNAITFAARPGLAKGDGVVLYAAGTGLIFAVGSVTSYPYLAEEDATTGWPWRVNVKLDHWRQFIHDGEPLSALSVEDRDLRKVIKRRSHIRLSDAEYAAATQALA
ncbi:MAG TPA: hypothetical protein VFJ64_02940 [Solirubrobacterales bacterium]|nr:hypothetical protein [Solirubrobacterales bacterium]